MEILADENSTRKNIIFLLKKNGGMSIEELSKVIDITPMGIRQHLLALEKKSYVTYVTKKRGIGRPGFIYMLTEAADDLFPKSYDSFAIGILKDIRKHDGNEKVDEIFGWRKERLYTLMKGALAEKEKLDDILSALKRILEAEGYLVEIGKHNGRCSLKQFHCPINKVAQEFADACKHELQLYRDLISKDITREGSIADGGTACVYTIPYD